MMRHICVENPDQEAGKTDMEGLYTFASITLISGADPTQEDWKLLADVCKRKNHFPVFDMAYQVFN